MAAIRNMLFINYAHKEDVLYLSGSQAVGILVGKIIGIHLLAFCILVRGRFYVCQFAHDE